jgi:hypothetical protein
VRGFSFFVPIRNRRLRLQAQPLNRNRRPTPVASGSRGRVRPSHRCSSIYVLCMDFSTHTLGREVEARPSRMVRAQRFQHHQLWTTSAAPPPEQYRHTISVPEAGATREDERLTEDESARRTLGPRGVPGSPDTAKMTPQQQKNIPETGVFDGHTA